MIELRQQVDSRGQPFDFDKVYRDGRFVAIVPRCEDAPVLSRQRIAESEAAALLRLVNEAREGQGLFGPCESVTQPARPRFKTNVKRKAR